MPLYRMTAETFFRSVDADVFPRKDPVYLRDGQIFTKLPRNLARAASAECLFAALVPAVPADWSFWIQSFIFAHEFSAPLPDLCLIRGRAQDYYRRQSFPKADDIALVVEIADSSLSEDRNAALVDYAKAGLLIYWIINLIDWQIEVYTGPETVGEASRYTQRVDYRVGQDVPVILAGVEVARVPAGSILPGERRLA